MKPLKVDKTLTLSNGLKMPSIAFGCAFGNWTNKDQFMGFQPDLAWKTIPLAIKSGYLHYDSALVYGTHQILGHSLGQSFANNSLKRENVFIKTKIFHPSTPLALNSLGNSWDMSNKDINVEERVIHDVERSLFELNLGYLDMVVLHWPGDWNTSDRQHGKFMRKEVWKALEVLYKKGKVRSIGVSNFLERHFDFLESATVKPMLNQIEINPYIQQKNTTQFCLKHNIVIEAWSPFGSGSTGLFNDPVLQKIAVKYNKNIGQIILRWLLQKGYAAIPKSSHEGRMQANLDIFNFNLDEQDTVLIDRLDKNLTSVITSETIA